MSRAVRPTGLPVVEAGRNCALLPVLNIFDYGMRTDADMAYNELAMAVYSKVSGDPGFGFIGMKGSRRAPRRAW